MAGTQAMSFTRIKGKKNTVIIISLVLSVKQNLQNVRNPHLYFLGMMFIQKQPKVILMKHDTLLNCFINSSLVFR